MHLFPSSFSDTMKAQLGGEWSAFDAAHDAAPPVSIRLNPRKQAAIVTDRPVPWSRYGHYLAQRPSFTFDPRFHAGAYYVQEASSMFLEQAFMQIGGDAEGLTVLDLCAAPGGKSTHLLSLMSPESTLVSNEVIRTRATILSENIQKWGAHNAIVTSSDPQQFSALESVFDIAVVDAPCSGEGLFRKDPSAIDAWSPENVELCARRQHRILEDIWPAIKNGGFLIYSTCTYNQLENESNLTQLLSQGDAQSFSLDIDPAWNVTPVNLNGVQAYRFYPHKTTGEGFFLAVMRKTSGAMAPRMKASGDLAKVPARIEEEIRTWLNVPLRYFLHKEEIRAVPLYGEKLLGHLSRHLYIVNAGTLIGTAKQNKVVPAHAAALSVHLDQGRWSQYDVDHDTAIRYLRKEAITAADLPRGFALVKYQGLPLGWINVLDTRANNLYPAEWRIRSQGRSASEDPGVDLS
jgi:16S rRNA C967 or C1407 C5-methylase (RsmB/RsmF family)/NOL1/NOP2/fmu family ribosome biogenesis protein